MEENTQQHTNALPVGSKLQEFEILSVLGQGGFGITYKVKDTNLEKIMAIKEYMPSQFASRSNKSTVTHTPKDKDIFEWGKQRFLEEAKLVANHLDHISLVKVYRYFEANNTAYFVMDYYEGETLEDYLKRHPNKHYTQVEILSVLMPIIEGLKAVHNKGYLHRDIASDNIFLRIDKLPILIDFGASRNALGVKSQSISAIVKHGYSPPEQYASNSTQDATSDLYAMSAVMYEMIAGKI
jgi:serine/threonine protein kinase